MRRTRPRLSRGSGTYSRQTDHSARPRVRRRNANDTLTRNWRRKKPVSDASGMQFGTDIFLVSISVTNIGHALFSCRFMVPVFRYGFSAPISGKGKCKDKGLDTCYGATYMSQTRDQQRFTISEVATDWHESMVPQRIMWPSVARSNRNWTHGAASRHTIAPISHTRPSPRSRSYYLFPVPLRVGG